MKYLNGLLTLFFVVSFLGCSSVPSTRLQVQRSPEIIIPNAKSVRINRFDSSSNSYGYNLAGIHRTDVESSLFQTNTFKVVSRGPADMVLGGSLNFSSDVYTSDSATTDKDGRTVYTYNATRTGVLQVQLMVTDNSGDLVGVSQFDISESSTGTGYSPTEAYEQMMSAYDMYNIVLKRSVGEIVKRVTPYTEHVRRTFAEAKNEKIEIANKAAGQGDWKNALSGWKSAQSDGADSKAASYYNHSIYYETLGDLDKALEFIQMALLVKQNNKFSARQDLLLGLIEERNSLQKHFKK